MLSCVCHRLRLCSWVVIVAQLTGRNLQGWGNLIMCPDAERKVLYAHFNIQRTQNGNVILSLCSLKQLNKVQESVATDLLGKQNRNQCQN